ncbi:hypothetical protein O7606_11380 [Micromonospora sp. WMMD882]|uniref:dihydrodipicolinate reductase C-terminal domain-containing protein n=1 Tax=Micromonospora sp. WMMD882 TaxID=3015151 RepID=UPI00248AC376|nr:dihydrodipicolinate reductase C-terminal domain-containing protein [Micromonospora sp. WMMD882]WBB81902.1 hypothetical protein O7606_11380 [Micromonospora sp. WMMD882]
MPERAGPDGPVVGVVGAGRLGAAVTRRCVAEGLRVRPLDSRQPAAWRTRPPDVLVDCAAPPATDRVLDACAELRTPLVECVSDLRPDQLVRLAELARGVAVVRATNLSLGNYLQTRVVERLAELLAGHPADAGPEAAVWERHPATKAHRPSATGVALADRWRKLTGRDPSDVASLRAGGPVSDHELRLSWPTQTLTVRHEVHALDAAATGAVAAARWAVGRSPGLYGAHDVYDDLLSSRPVPRGDGPKEESDDEQRSPY